MTRRSGLSGAQIASIVLLVIFGVIWLMPVVAALVDTVRANSGQPAAMVVRLLPRLSHALMLSVLVAVPAAALSTAFGAMAGYAGSKKRFFGRRMFLGALVGAIFIPAAVLMVPLLRVTATLGIYDTPTALILPCSATAFAVVFMKVAIDRISSDILDSARIDGLGELAVFTRMVLPQVRGPLAALLFIEFISNWGALAVPMAVVDSPRNSTLPLYLGSALQSLNPPAAAQLLLAVALVAVPAIVLFLLKSGDIISGLLATLFRYERVDGGMMNDGPSDE